MTANPRERLQWKSFLFPLFAEQKDWNGKRDPFLQNVNAKGARPNKKTSLNAVQKQFGYFLIFFLKRNRQLFNVVTQLHVLSSCKRNGSDFDSFDS